MARRSGRSARRVAEQPASAEANQSAGRSTDSTTDTTSTSKVDTSTDATSTPSGRALLRDALPLTLGLTLIALLVPAPPGHGFVPLFDAGRALAALGLALALAHTLLPTRAPRALAPISLLLLLLGLGAYLGRHVWDFRVFADLRPAEFGAPSELAWVALVLGLNTSRARSDRARRLALGLTALGLGWGAIALFVPEPTLTGETSALVSSLASPTRLPLAGAMLGALALGAWSLFAAFRRSPPPPTRYLPHALALAALLAALTSITPLPALCSLILLVAITRVAARLLADRELAPSPGIDKALLYSTVVGVVLVWLLLKSQALIASNTDENIYFYMAKLLGDGKWPYADYFFAHPPLHVVLPGLFFAVFGFSLTFAKLFPLLATLGTGLSIFALARRAFSPLPALLALVLFLFAAEVLKASSNMTGVNMTTMWLALGAWQALKGHPVRAGLLLGAAVTTGFYAMAPALALVALAFFWHPDPALDSPDRSSARRPGLHHGLRLAAAFLLSAALVNLVFYAIGGDTFLEGVYAYHQQKSFEDPDMVELFGGAPGFPASLLHNLSVMTAGKDFIKEVFYHPHLWLAALALPVVAFASWLAAPERGRLYRIAFPTTLFRSGPDGRALVVWLVALALFVQFAMFRELYSFYFVLIYPFLALCAAYVVWRGLSLLVPSAPTATAPPPPRPPLRPLAAALLGLLAVLTLGAHALVSDAHQAVFDDELEVTGARNDYAWTVPPVLPALAGIPKLLFWEGHRFRAAIEPGYRHYLWTKKRGFTVLGEVADFIRAASAPDETLAGASTLAPLVALLADRRIAADEIDTNNKRFKTGLLSEPTYWAAICDDRVRFIVGTPRSYFTQDKLDAMPIIARYFEKVRVFSDPTLQYNSPFVITLYRRTGDAPCRWE